MNDIVKFEPSREYKISIFDSGNVLILRSESPLLDDSRMENFDFPLRESSGRALGKATDFGGHLVTRVAEQISGTTSVQLQLYQATVTLGGIYDPANALKQMEQIIRDLCNDAWLAPTITTQLHSTKKKEDYVHPFGKLSLRLYEQRQHNRRKMNKRN